MRIEEITNRLKRIEGQVRGLQRMVGEERECEAILTQVMAARAALDRVALLVAENYVQECVLPADPELARQRLGRVLELVLARFSIPAIDESAAAQEPTKGELNMAKPIEVTDQTFDQVVLEAELPTAVDFWAVWCGPCKMIAPVLEQIADEYEDQIQIAKLDVDYNNESAIRYGVMSIPTLILFKDGEPVERIIGFMPKEKLLAKLQPHLQDRQRGI